MEYISAKRILIRNKSTSWFGTDHTMNLYRGCCHGCIYCDSRSSCYQIPDFDTVRAKQNALPILRDELARKIRPAFISMGSMSDPYNPFEKELKLTQHALELINAYECGVSIATKSDLICRDIPILQFIASHSPVVCKMTVTTTDDTLARKLEPRAPSPTRRLAAVKELSDAGLFTGILLMPVVPFLEDEPENVLRVVDAAAQAGAKFVYAAFGMTMRDGQRDYFLRELDRAFPERKLSETYLRRYRDRYTCTSPRAAKLWSLFTQRCREHGLLFEMKHIISAAKQNYADAQLTFFD